MDSWRVPVQNAAKKSEPAASEPAEGRPHAAAKKAKLSVLLITRDDMLWPQIGPHVGRDLILKQVDSIDELVTAMPAGNPAIILWDARLQTDAAAMLSRLQLHSPRLAVVVLDEASGAHTWTSPIALRQVIAHLTVPVLAGSLTVALAAAHEEVQSRIALLGESNAAASSAPTQARKIPWIPAAIVLGVLIAAAVLFFALRNGDSQVNPAAPASAERAPAQSATAPAATPAASPASSPAAAPTASDERVDLLIEKAQQAMLERHFIDPADGSALNLYRSALQLKPDNGEARQGLQRLAEILFARVQSALDERKFDVALQALETARSINPSDSRLPALDERIASLRAELGPAQILATINAQNFERAAQLIDEAARTKALNGTKLTQLRDELRRRHDEFDIANYLKLIDTRLQQDKLIEPRNDSAVYYLGQARTAGASAAALQPQSQEIYKRLAQTLHTDIDQRHLGDADRLLADMRNYGVPAQTMASLQHDLTVAHSQQAAAAIATSPLLDLAQSRLAQGKLTEPENDSALFYVNQLRATDPNNSGLSRVSNAVQAQILDQVRVALDAGQPAIAEPLLQSAASLGTSPDLDMLNQRLAQLKLGNNVPEVSENLLTRIKGIELEYPPEALRRGTEGWVDLTFVVTAEGRVTKVNVLNASPSGVFESAATRAVSRERYKPMMQGGKAIAVSTKLRITFRLSK
jgi:TonB family protein